MPSSPAILVVDDTADMLKATVRILQQAGYRVEQAVDGASALEAVCRSHPRLVLLDVDLPDVSGLDILRKIRSIPDFVPVSVVMLSSHQIQAEHQAAGLDAGSDGYIVRPIHNAELLARVRMHLRQCELSDLVHASEARYRDLINLQVNGVLVIDSSGVILFTNPAAQEILGRSKEDLIGTNFEAPIGAASAHQLTLQNKDRGPIFVEMRVAPSEWEGRPSFVVGLTDITERKRAEDAQLRESEERFHAIASNTPDHVLMQDRELRYRLVINPQLGLTEADMLGKTDWDFLGKDDAEKLTAIKRKVMETGTPVQLETSLENQKGGTDFFEGSYIPKLDATGKADGLIGYFRNITAHKQAEEALRESEERFRKVFEEGPLGMVMVSVTDGRFTRANGAFCRMLGYTEEELKHLTFADVTHPEERNRDVAAVRRLWGGQIPDYATEKRYLNKDGTALWARLSASLIRSATGKPLYFLAMIDDITERKRAEAAQRESEEKFRTFFERSNVGMSITSVSGKLLQVNQATCEMLGYSQTELQQGNWQSITHPEDVELTQREVAALVTGQKHSTRFAKRFLHKDGSVVWGDLSSTVLRDAVNQSLCLMTAIVDITERKRVEVERVKLEALNRQLLKTESLGRMAGAIAHRLNNQIQAVMLNLELATRNQPENVGPLESLIEAKQSAREAAEVGTLMLTYLGQAEVKKAQLDLAEVCGPSLALLRSAMPPGVVLETDLPTPGPVISANANQLQQVLTSLINNAWEASGERRGAIRLSVKTVSAADIPAAVRFPINWQPQDSATAYACLEVADVGCGIDAKDIDKLFDPFFSTKSTGRGLGLPVVLGIARSHAGVVTVESEPSRGSTFRVYIPVSPEAILPKPVEVQAGPISESVRRGGTVLVVEDEPLMRKSLALVLRHSGLTVLEAEDGVAAVEIFRQHRDEIGCVVCDLTMPRMNGWETLTALRQLVPGIGVILASGYSEAQAMEGDHPERPQAFLHKPYDAKVLINAINQILPSNA